jgi:protein-L-isoaspartate(D-aspartate) O-methyltransferase
MSRLVDNLIRKGYLKTDLITEAFWEIDRIEFVPKDLEPEAEVDIPLPIGYGQTISQPLTVAFMLELLDPKRGQNILDIGSGSGWTTSLLSYITGKEGKVTAIERNPNLYELGKTNTEKFGYVSKEIARFICADGNKGFSENAPYDRILVSASAQCVPNELKDQLKIGGKMVLPIGNSLWYMEKKGENEYTKEEFPGFNFVPLISN